MKRKKVISTWLIKEMPSVSQDLHFLKRVATQIYWKYFWDYMFINLEMRMYGVNDKCENIGDRKLL